MLTRRSAIAAPALLLPSVAAAASAGTEAEDPALAAFARWNEARLEEEPYLDRYSNAASGTEEERLAHAAWEPFCIARSEAEHALAEATATTAAGLHAQLLFGLQVFCEFHHSGYDIFDPAGFDFDHTLANDLYPNLLRGAAELARNG